MLGNNGFDSAAVTDRDDQRIPHPDEGRHAPPEAPPAGGPFVCMLVMQTTIVPNNDYRPTPMRNTAAVVVTQ